jgi:hypothetical protein
MTTVKHLTAMYWRHKHDTNSYCMLWTHPDTLMLAVYVMALDGWCGVMGGGDCWLMAIERLSFPRVGYGKYVYQKIRLSKTERFEKVLAPVRYLIASLVSHSRGVPLHFFGEGRSRSSHSFMLLSFNASVHLLTHTNKSNSPPCVYRAHPAFIPSSVSPSLFLIAYRLKRMALLKTLLLLQTCTLIAAKEKQPLNSFNEPTYGVDVSFPIHHEKISTNYAWLPHNLDEDVETPKEYEGMPVQYLGKRQEWYDEFMMGCHEHYGR